MCNLFRASPPPRTQPVALTRNGRTAENAEASAVRTNRAYTHGCCGLDCERGIEVGRLPLSEPAMQLPARLQEAVREDRRALGSVGRS